LIQEGQNIYDFCLQKYGTLENIFNVLDDNKLTLNSDLNSGMELNYDARNKGNVFIKKYIDDNNVVPVNFGSALFNFINIFFNNTNKNNETGVQDGQNIFDICLQYFGDLTYIFDIIDNNNITLNTFLNSGQELNISNFEKGDQGIKDFVLSNNLKINNNSIYPTTGSQFDSLLQWPFFVDKDIIMIKDLIIL